MTTLTKKPIIIIFFIQLALLTLLTILSIIGGVIESLNIGAFFFSIIMGAIGASISILNRMKKADSKFSEEFEKINLWAILMPILYGTLLSGVSYLFFMSGILSGDGGNGLLTSNLFPNFGKITETSDNILKQFMGIRPETIQDTGKLLVWSFIAGYSEKFVINILSELEN